jgi:tRNA pseudouridine55 synthase
MDKEILLVDKPKGITSFDVIRILRTMLHIKKIGHAGTLDPNASGLMLLGIDQGTKKLTELSQSGKTYEATILLGVKTDSGDTDGTVLEEVQVSELNIERIESALRGLLGTKTYEVPKYSAIKKNGKKLYELARAGIETEPTFREMTVYKIENIKYNHPYIKATFDVSKGTYIRSLAEYVGQTLGLPSTLSDLRRTSIGEYSISNAITLPDELIKNYTNKKRH